jgi:uncharacterized protein YggU (UPF0235/DUF167 family)
VSAHLDRAGGDVRLRIRLTPNARADGFGALHEDGDGVCWLKASVRAVPEKGKANLALVALVSKASGIAKSRIGLVCGAASRAKVLRIEAATQAEIAVLAGLVKP